MSTVSSDEIRKIGFNSDFHVGSRRLHVQTEVVGRMEYSVTSMVYEGGSLLQVEKQTCPVAGRGIDQIREFVRLAHEDFVERVKRGEVG